MLRNIHTGGCSAVQWRPGGGHKNEWMNAQPCPLLVCVCVCLCERVNTACVCSVCASVTSRQRSVCWALVSHAGFSYLLSLFLSFVIQIPLRASTFHQQNTTLRLNNVCVGRRSRICLHNTKHVCSRADKATYTNALLQSLNNLFI